MTSVPTPEEARRLALARRNAQPREESLRLSAEIVTRFLTSIAREQWKNLHVGLYRSVGSELDLSSLEEFLKAHGAFLYFPRVTDRPSKTMEMVEVPPSIPEPWPKGAYGILEPPLMLAPADPTLLQFIFVPGAAFGWSGERVGQGAGYYDRFLIRTPNAIRVSLAFDCQVLPKIGLNSWDQSVDWLVTESGEFCGPRARKWRNEPRT